jgi:hypothetical protein
VLKNYSRPVILLSLLEKLYATLRRGELLHGHALLRVVKNTGQVGTLLELVIAILHDHGVGGGGLLMDQTTDPPPHDTV